MLKGLARFAWVLCAGALLAATASADDRKADEKSAAQSLTYDDKRFIDQAGKGGIAEVQEAKLAQEQGRSDHVKDAARHLEKDHTAANEKLTTIAREHGVTLSHEPAEERKPVIAKLKQLRGDEFDREYVRGQIDAHEKTIALFQQAHDSTKNAAIKSYTAATLPKLKEHLAMMKEMQTRRTASKE